MLTSSEPDSGLNSRTIRSWSEPKSDTQLTEPSRCPLDFSWGELSLSFTYLQKWEGSVEHSLEKVALQLLEEHSYDIALDKEKTQSKVEESFTLFRWPTILSWGCLKGTAKMRPWAQVSYLAYDSRKQATETGDSHKRRESQHNGSLSRSPMWATWAQLDQDS